MLPACLCLVTLFMAQLGRFGGNLVFGLLLSIHASGLGLMLEPKLPPLQFRGRLLLTLGLLLALGGLVYSPGRAIIEKRLFAPVRVHDRVVIIEKFRKTPLIGRGDWIAYSLPEGGNHDAYFLPGFGLSPVLAGPGDAVHFSETSFEVNGIPRDRLTTMPDSGDLTVPEKHWFVWPDVSINGHGLLAEGTIGNTILRMAIISEAQFEGRPFKRWFWHRQYVP